MVKTFACYCRFHIVLERFGAWTEAMDVFVQQGANKNFLLQCLFGLSLFLCESVFKSLSFLAAICLVGIG